MERSALLPPHCSSRILPAQLLHKGRNLLALCLCVFLGYGSLLIQVGLILLFHVLPYTIRVLQRSGVVVGVVEVAPLIPLWCSLGQLLVCVATDKLVRCIRRSRRGSSGECRRLSTIQGGSVEVGVVVGEVREGGTRCIIGERGPELIVEWTVFHLLVGKGLSSAIWLDLLHSGGSARCCTLSGTRLGLHDAGVLLDRRFTQAQRVVARIQT